MVVFNCLNSNSILFFKLVNWKIYIVEPVKTLIKPSERFRKNHFEQKAWAQGQVVCGIDEVGRGCLAGPLVTAAVILPPGKAHPMLKDSKIMLAPERERAALWIEKNCFWALGIVHHRIIDQHNIWHATLIAMKRALVNLLSIAPRQPSAILIDAMPLNLFDTDHKAIPVYYFPFGESKSSSIAAASIIAKVKRDAMMTRVNEIFPGYHFDQNKGYRTPVHKKIVRAGSQLIIHRQNYLTHVLAYTQYDQQQSILAQITQEEIMVIQE